MNWQDFSSQHLNGRNRRLLHEWSQLDRALEQRDTIEYQIMRRNEQGLPTMYLITYHIHSICGVEQLERLNEPGIDNKPIFASTFLMRIYLPENYPCVDAPAEFYFLTYDKEGQTIPHPWHPNIRYFGNFAGRVPPHRIEDRNGSEAYRSCILPAFVYTRYLHPRSNLSKSHASSNGCPPRHTVPQHCRRITDAHNQP